MLEENKKEVLKPEVLEQISSGTSNADYKYKIGYFYYIDTMDDTYRYYKVVDYNEDLNCPYTSEVYL